MMTVKAADASRIGKRGVVVIPAKVRKQFDLNEGDYVIVQPGPDGILLRPARLAPVELYSPERQAEFLLSNAVTSAEYRKATAQVRKLGLDPKRIPHFKPKAAR